MLFDSETSNECILLWTIPNESLNLGKPILLMNVNVVDPDLSGQRKNLVDEHFESCTLPGSIRPKQSEAFSWQNSKTKITHNSLAFDDFSQSFNLNSIIFSFIKLLTKRNDCFISQISNWFRFYEWKF
jgi:hypothetical protein